MTCTACGHANPAESSFCLACGRPLMSACAQCGTQLPANARFCNKCGASVYAWFTEGFTTRDLQDAKALVREL